MRSRLPGPHGTDLLLGPPVSLTHFPPWHLEKKDKNSVCLLHHHDVSSTGHGYFTYSCFYSPKYLWRLAGLLNEWTKPQEATLD